ncbi:MAG TPA: SDR family oxidoreductase [Pyrinomonadaceae bacterium]|nr:SDR family oxidoreductase [Pyrinomonadaceae bacterium]
MTTRETIFVTGFPGFIASRLVQRLAQGGGKFLLLVQPALASQARSDLQQIAGRAQKPLADFQILEGDISQPDLGLSPRDLEIARSEATLIFHLAALYDLAVAREPAMLVNVTGTRNMNTFAKSAPNLRRYHYVSTCYVAGKRRGRILETDLRHDAGFRNYYEETKYLAETEVAGLKADLPITIHRPSVVCGDSVSGETAKFDGIYYLIKYLLKSPSLFSILNIGNREVKLNLVPVDFVVESLAALARDSRALGKTLQHADPNPLSTRELFDVIAEEISGHSSRITLPAPLVHFSLMLPVSPAITGLPHSAVPYFFLDQTYDTTEATALLSPLGITCPAFPSYAHNIVAFAAASNQ